MWSAKHLKMTATRQKLVIIGSGWGGFELLRCLNHRLNDVHIISPRNYFVFTPLLASTCTGTLEFRSVTEPIRRIHPDIKYYQAIAEDVDFTHQLINCKSLARDEQDVPATFNVNYDKLVIACGASSNTFGIPGVSEHALFLKDIEDARRIRHRVLECFELAKRPLITAEQVSRLLHFAIIGGGPTGIEFAAELHDLIQEDLRKIYPDLMPLVRITVYDVAPRILGSFDEKLASYAMEKFSRAGIKVATRTQIAKVKPHSIVLGDGTEVEVGMTVWATGLTAANFTLRLGETLAMDERKFRLLTDRSFNVFTKAGNDAVLTNVFAIGDCATIKDHDAPCTAQVAYQKARHLASQILNKPANPVHNSPPPFRFQNRGMLAYIGGWRAVADLGSHHQFSRSGRVAWIFWRSAYFVMTVSVRNKILIPMYWFLSWAFGRDISKI